MLRQVSILGKLVLEKGNMFVPFNTDSTCINITTDLPENFLSKQVVGPPRIVYTTYCK